MNRPESSVPDRADTTSSALRRAWARPSVRFGTLAIALFAIAAVAGVWWFLRDDAPAEANLADAVETLDPAETPDPADATTTDPTDPTDPAVEPADDPVTAESAPGGDEAAAATDGGETGLDGSWAVDTTIGEFSYEDSTGTFVGFRLEEELRGIGSTTAVGRTPDVTGTVVIEGTTVTAVDIEADMTTVTTNDGRRDDEVQAALDTRTFPTATFVLGEPIELGEGASTGEAVTTTATGALTIHGVTRDVEVAIDAQLVDDTIVIVGSLDVVFSDYQVQVPTAPIVLSVEDNGIVELQLFLRN